MDNKSDLYNELNKYINTMSNDESILFLNYNLKDGMNIMAL